MMQMERNNSMSMQLIKERIEDLALGRVKHSGFVHRGKRLQ